MVITLIVIEVVVMVVANGVVLCMYRNTDSIHADTIGTLKG